MNKIERALGILLVLRGGKAVSAAELARRFEVSRRTIHRDIETLSALGIPVYAERGRGGGFRLMEHYFLPPIMFTPGEGLALVVGLALLDSLRSKPFAGNLDTAERKLLAAVPESVRQILVEARSHIGFETLHEDIFHPEVGDAPLSTASAHAPASLARESDAVSVFVEGVITRRAVAIEYRSPYRPVSEAVVTPYGAFWDRGFWYLAGMAVGRADGVRLWRADRVVAIRSVETPASMSPSAEFDIRAYLGHQWLGTAMEKWARDDPVCIRLTPRLAERLQRDWYLSHARYEPRADGDVLMTFGEDKREFVFELLRWLGPDAELIAPLHWRAELHAQLTRMLALYARDADV